MSEPDSLTEPSMEAGPSGSRFRRLKGPVWLRTLRVRLAVPFIALTTLVLVVLFFLIGESAESVYIDRLSDELVNEASLAAFAIEQASDGGASTGNVRALVDELSRLSDTRVTLIEGNGVVIADSEANPETTGNHNDRPEVADARASGSGRAIRFSETVGERFLYVAVPVDGTGGHILRVAVPLDQVDSAVAGAQRSILGAVALVTVLSILAAWAIAGRLAEPLEALRAQAERVAAGEFSSRVEPVGTVEIDAVGDAFNTMTADLEHSVDAQERASIRLQAIMGGLADGVVLTDADGLVLRMNDAAASMLDSDEDSSRGRPFVQVARDHEMAQVLWAALDGDKKNPSATVVYGLQRLAILVTACTVDGAHERLGLVVLRDVTELRRLESVRREFVANVSHELRTPLTSIRALVETLEGGVIEDQEMTQDFLGRIVGEVDRLNALVEDLLEFARLEAGRTPLKLERVSIGDAVRHGVERLRPQIERARLSLETEVEEELPEIEVDVGRIEQVLLNLVHNAIKFTPAGGEIRVGVCRKKGEIAVEVRDTGVGIAEEDLGRLFERFYKSDKARRSEGTGLGLAIAKHIVQLHGGEITVESAPGEGASFTFTLPIRRKRARKRARRYAARLA